MVRRSSSEGRLTIAEESHKLDARQFLSPSALNGTDQREVPIGGVTKWHDLKPNEGPRDSEGWCMNVAR